MADTCPSPCLGDGVKGCNQDCRHFPCREAPALWAESFPILLIPLGKIRRHRLGQKLQVASSRQGLHGNVCRILQHDLRVHSLPMLLIRLCIASHHDAIRLDLIIAYSVIRSSSPCHRPRTGRSPGKHITKARQNWIALVVISYLLNPCPT